MIVRCGDGHIFGLDAANGERKWEYQATLPPLLLRAESGVTSLRDLVLAGLAGRQAGCPQPGHRGARCGTP